MKSCSLGEVFLCVYSMYLTNILGRTGVVQKLLQTLGEQKVPEPIHLGLQLPDQLGVGIFVDDGVAADLLGPVGVPGSIAEHSDLTGFVKVTSDLWGVTSDLRVLSVSS